MTEPSGKVWTPVEGVVVSVIEDGDGRITVHIDGGKTDAVYVEGRRKWGDRRSS
jgi:hypothetical protein